MEDFERQSVASAELEHGEHLVWYGQPSGAAFSKTKWPIFIFGIPWTAFSLFWVGMAFFMTQGTGTGIIEWIFPAFGLPFIAIGFWMLGSPFWAAKKAERIVYAITNKRAVIISAGTSKKVQSFYGKDIRDVYRVEKPDGSGNLFFSTGSNQSFNDGSVPMKSGFHGIPDVRMVEIYMKDFLKSANGE